MNENKAHKPNAYPSESYELKIDEQVNKLLDLNHKLTFFMITAAVGTLGFTLNFAVKNKLAIALDKLHLGLIVSASIFALLSAGLSLIALNADIRSFRLHLKNRYLRKSYDELPENEKKLWDKVINKAEWSRRLSFIFLITTVSLQAIFLVVAFISKGEG